MLRSCQHVRAQAQAPADRTPPPRSLTLRGTLLVAAAATVAAPAASKSATPAAKATPTTAPKASTAPTIPACRVERRVFRQASSSHCICHALQIGTASQVPRRGAAQCMHRASGQSSCAPPPKERPPLKPPERPPLAGARMLAHAGTLASARCLCLSTKCALRCMYKYVS